MKLYHLVLFIVWAFWTYKAMRTIYERPGDLFMSKLDENAKSHADYLLTPYSIITPWTNLWIILHAIAGICAILYFINWNYELL